MFLVAYLWWVGNAFLISYIPHDETSGELVPRVHFSLASTIEYRTVFLSWFALLPLLEANGLGRLSHVLYFLLPASLFSDPCSSQWLPMAWVSCGFGKRIFRQPWARFSHWGTPPSSHSRSRRSVPVLHAVPCACPLLHQRFGLRARGTDVLSPRYAGIKRFYEQYGRRIVIADMQVTMVSLAFLWLAVVGAI